MVPAPPVISLEPFVNRAVSIGVQSVLFNNKIEHLRRAIASLARSAELGISAGLLTGVTLHLGDCSSMACLSHQEVEKLGDEFGKLKIVYDHFRENLGSAEGHNRLARNNSADFVLIQNPEVIDSPRLLETLVNELRVPGIGMVEAKQLPIEHPKDYDPITGETSWASTACALIPASLFRGLEGFDSHSFFLYCDDVDFSWRVRNAGYRVVFQPAAVVFHDKRLSATGKWLTSSAERYYSAEASLFLAHKWSRPDLVESYLQMFAKSNDQDLKRAYDAFDERRKRGTLPVPLDPEHKVAQFVGMAYAKHRFVL